MRTSAEVVWYFAYGSNTDPRRFRDRVGPWRRRVRARLDGFALKFSEVVTSEGGGGAVVVRSPGDSVAGVAFAITRGQLKKMDAEELDPGHDPEGRGCRLSSVVSSDEGPLDVLFYTVDPAGGPRPPSSGYLGHITRGLTEAGYPRSVVEAVLEIAEDAGRSQAGDARGRALGE